MALHDADVDALEQPMELFHRQHRHGLNGGPDEAVLLQSFEQQPEAVAVPTEDLHAVATAVAEDVHARRERIQAQRLVHQQRQAVDVEPEVDRTAVKVDLQGRVGAEPRTLPSASITSPAWRRSHSRSSTTTPLGRRACRHIRTTARLSPAAVGIGVVAAASIGTATNASRDAGDTATARWRRSLCSRTQRLSWLALIPHSRASRDTDTPGLHAATNSALAASSYTLRPSLLRPTTSRRFNSSIPSDITFPRLPTWERRLSDGDDSLKDGVHCALTVPKCGEAWSRLGDTKSSDFSPACLIHFCKA